MTSDNPEQAWELINSLCFLPKALWIHQNHKTWSLIHLDHLIHQMALPPNLPIDALLTDHELIRFHNLKGKRQWSYLGARLACKHLFRQLMEPGIGAALIPPPNQINTTSVDYSFPVCPDNPAHDCYYFTVTHDRTFVVSAASTLPIGIDVEQISERPFKVRSYFMSPHEIALCDRWDRGIHDAATHIWTIKEAYSKAIRTPLMQVWKRIEVRHLGNATSQLVDGNRAFEVSHHRWNDEVFSSVILTL